MRRPTASFSRSRRIVSTSGSSGIESLLGARLFERLPCQASRRLLSLLLRPALAAAEPVITHAYGCEEPLGMVGAVVDDLVLGKCLEGAGRELLQPRLVVLAAGTGGGIGDPIAQQAQHEIRGRLPPPVEIDGADHRLRGVGQDRRLLPSAGRVLALSEPEHLAQAEL